MLALLTIIAFLNYSKEMDADLKALEQKLTTLINFCTSLKDDNKQLRDALNQSQQDIAKLHDNMQIASTKLEALMRTLPTESYSSDETALENEWDKK